jgi:hypothetical protein
MTQRYQLICASIILALLFLAGIAGFFLPTSSRSPELIAPSRCAFAGAGATFGPVAAAEQIYGPPWRRISG